MSSTNTRKDAFKLAKANGDRTIKFAAYADPPGVSPTGEIKILTHPHGWASDAADRMKGLRLRFDKGTFGEITDAAWDSEGGVIIVGEMPLNEAVLIDGAELRLGLTSLCASIEYNTRSDRKSDLTYCEGVRVDQFLSIYGGGGCNPMAEVMYPGAPNFSKAIRSYRHKHMKTDYNYDNRVQQYLKRPVLTDEYLASMFPNQGFGQNRILEKFASGFKRPTEFGVVARRKWGMQETTVDVLERAMKLRGGSRQTFLYNLEHMLQDM